MRSLRPICFLSVLFVCLLLGAQERQNKLAVMEIEDRSGTLDKTMLENAAEALRTEIGATNKFVLISKSRQRQVLIKEEKKESWKECYDQSCRIQLGQALTADQILTSMVNLFGGVYTIAAELVDLAKEATVKTAKAEFDGTEKGLAVAIKALAAQIADDRGKAPSVPAGRAAAPAWLSVTTDHADIDVFLDSTRIGRTPLPKKELAAGMHKVEIIDPCFLPVRELFEVAVGETKHLSFDLTQKNASLQVAARDGEGALLEGIVLVDGKKVGTAPGRFSVPLCSKELVVKTESGMHKQALKLDENGVSTVVATIDTTPSVLRTEATPTSPSVTDRTPSWTDRHPYWKAGVACTVIGVLAAGGGLALDLVAADKYDTYRSMQDPAAIALAGEKDSYIRSAEDIREEGRGMQIGSWVAYGVGGALAVSGIVMLFITKEVAEETVAIGFGADGGRFIGTLSVRF